MKKALILILALCLVFAGCSTTADDTAANTESTSTEKVYTIGYVTDQAGLGDQAFNDACYSGLKAAEDQSSNIKLTVIEPEDASQIESSLRTLAREGNELIVAGASALGDGVRVVAQEFPDAFFIIIDGDIADYDNVMSATFKEEEAAYLAGAFAKMYAGEGNKIAFIGGMDIPVIKKFEVGYTEGAKAVGASEDDVLITYTGVFNDTALGKKTAEAQNANGATVIFSAAGACNLGMFEAAETLDFAALGAATGQFDKSNAIVASHVKSVDSLLEKLALEFATGATLENGIVKNGLKEAGVAFRYNPANEENGVEISQEIKDKIEELEQQIIDGQIDVSSFLE